MGNASFPARALSIVTHARAVRTGSRARVVAERMATHDWLVMVQLVVLLILTLAGTGTAKPLAIAFLSMDLMLFGGVLAYVRSSDRVSPVSAMVYRLSLVATVVAVYLQLRWILPVVSHHSLDAQLFAFDLRVLGFEPAAAFDRWVTPRATEWFSFFYYSYFFLLALFAIPIAVAFEDGPPLREFAFGILFLYCVGHLVYTVVPGFGPWIHLDTFENELDGPVFWPLVRDMVEGAGAGKDIFPSLHTATPLFLALYAFRHRKRAPFGVVWPALAFFSSQIILATMYLRWHWVIDVFAGATLAIVASVIGPRITRWEASRRAAQGLPAAFPDSPVARWLAKHPAT
jgi:hypothetical protein